MAEISPNWNSLYSNSGIRIQGNPGLDSLNQRYATMLQQRAQDSKMLNDAMAKINLNGVKPQDLPALQKQYGEIRDIFNQYRSENDPQKQARLESDIRTKQQQLMYDAAQKVEAHKWELANAEKQNAPNAPVRDGSRSQMAELIGMPSGTPEYEAKKQELVNNQWLPKTTDWVDTFSKVAKLASSKNTTTAIVRDPVTGEHVNKKVVTDNINPQDFYDGIVTKLHDPNMLQSAMHEFGGSTPEETAGIIYNKLYPVMSKHYNNTDVTTGNPFETGAERRSAELGKEKSLALWKRDNGISEGSQLTPTQILGQQLAQDDPDAKDKFLGLIPKNTYYPGEKPTVTTDPVTGVQTFNFPRQAIKTNGKRLASTSYTLNPNSPNYLAKYSEMAADQHINLTRLNQIEGMKGGHGQVAQATHYTIKGKQYKSELVQEKAKASGMTVEEYVNELNNQK